MCLKAVAAIWPAMAVRSAMDMPSGRPGALAREARRRSSRETVAAGRMRRGPAASMCTTLGNGERGAGNGGREGEQEG